MEVLSVNSKISITVSVESSVTVSVKLKEVDVEITGTNWMVVLTETIVEVGGSIVIVSLV